MQHFGIGLQINPYSDPNILSWKYLKGVKLKSAILASPTSFAQWVPWGGTLIFSSYVRSGPASTVQPKKIQEFQAPPKNIWNFSNPQNNFPTSVPWP